MAHVYESAHIRPDNQLSEWSLNEQAGGFW